MRLLQKILLLLVACLHMSCKYQSDALDIPLEVEQLPTITEHSPASLIAFPFEESFPMKCEATGNPGPEFRWTKNDQNFDPYQDPRLITLDDSGTFIIPNNGNLTEFQGNYRCFATNKLGTAMSEEIEFIVPNVPKFPKEIIDPIEVIEGQSVILECNPPKGIPPLQIYWMTMSLQHIEQDERVSVGLNGNLYFSNAIRTDSRRDYCCFAAFPRIRTIVQKNAMSVVVKSNKLMKDSDSGSGRGYANSLLERKPSLLTPTGKESHKYLVKGKDLQLECIAEGFPTPEVEWVKIGSHKLPERVVVESHGKLLTVEMVNEEDEGKYMCRATNLYGDVMHYFHVTVEEPPEFEIEPQSQLVTIGADVVIKCVVNGNPQPSVEWRVNGQLLNDVPTSNRKVLKDDTISIHNAKPENSAVYQCEAKNRHGTILANANIMIMNIQPLILTENNLQYMAVEGKGVVMHCKVFSSPASSITWSKADSADAVEGERFSVHKNGSLEIQNIMKEDTGEYSCFAQNTEGKVAIAATLEVKDPTRIVDPPSDLRVLAGTTIQFSCQAEFDPSIGDDFEILWEKDGMALNGSENARYILDDGVLEIINVNFGDQGFYVCVARTPFDQDMALAQLSVVDVPDPPEDVILSEHNGRSVKLQWIPGDDHNSSITEFVIEFEENQHQPGSWREMMRVPGNHHSALLKLHGHVDYRFRVYAINEVGSGRPSQATERYKTPASAPDKNPENIKIEGHLPHEMDINWEPLSPIEHNGPGLEYKVSYRRQGNGEDWTEHMVKRHSFLVTNTPTFVLYEIKIQARNHVGWGPEPKIITAYSGEDFPSAAPEDVFVDVMNSTMMKVKWKHVQKEKLNGHLGGYRISYWRLRSLLDSKKTHGDKHTLTFSGERDHAVVTGLRLFSEYSLIVMAFNSRGNGPGSHPVSFKTPEGVPGQAAAFSVTNIQKHKVTLTWSPPVDANGVITGYILQYQLINDTEELGSLMTLNVSADSNKLHLQDLEALSKYKFYLRSCTRVGCGPAVSEERTTVPEANLAGIRGGISNQGWFIGLMCAIALLTLIVLIACFVNRNKGGKYSVKEKEDLHPDLESQGINDDTFCEYSDNDEKPLKSSQHSLNGDLKGGDSGDSMVDYGDEDAHFHEDGSFIGEYSGRKERVSMEIKGNNQSIA
ncbi:neural cell adhesion molecule L1-like protein isoform X9 [Carassius gibelio]|uniref:neural cell adhesion molecule L1-like protein isoform X9 n=1 Tax=Carassius gibelio TaxID=101364 RepID=UPI002278E9BF|nr:neural cell adhesion molecule L1-like protein isoform X9 [Carassius gibelio]XP_052415488.1 neural cell adhesion molecule L1-like protein isoform X9 [Carassius gibelio]